VLYHKLNYRKEKIITLLNQKKGTLSDLYLVASSRHKGVWLLNSVYWRNGS